MISKTEANQHYNHQLPPIENLWEQKHQQYWNNRGVCYIIFYVGRIRVRDRIVYVPGLIIIILL